MSEAATTKLHDTRQTIAAVNVDLSGSTFENAKLKAAVFRNVDVSDGVIEDANLVRLRVTDANLSGAVFAQCTMTGMTIDGVAVTDLVAAYRATRKGG
jgi:uncharacterized protein YjbI with pentapeptide repeats